LEVKTDLGGIVGGARLFQQVAETVDGTPVFGPVQVRVPVGAFAPQPNDFLAHGKFFVPLAYVTEVRPEIVERVGQAG
jgi:hypothetical protein